MHATKFVAPTDKNNEMKIMSVLQLLVTKIQSEVWGQKLPQDAPLSTKVRCHLATSLQLHSE